MQLGVSDRDPKMTGRAKTSWCRRSSSVYTHWIEYPREDNHFSSVTPQYTVVKVSTRHDADLTVVLGIGVSMVLCLNGCGMQLCWSIAD